MSSNLSDHYIKSRSGSQKKLSSFQLDDPKKIFRNSKLAVSSTKDCLFCGSSFKIDQRHQFSGLINRALYSKYSSSQNYYYTKDINEILSEARTPAVIVLKDLMHFDEEEEYLKRFYQYNEYDFKIKMLTEYYKFHNDIPRMFILPVTYVVNRYHDKKRRLEYIRVTKMLKEEQELLSPEAKVEEKKETKHYTITDRILDDLDLTETEPTELKRDTSPIRTDHPYFGKTAAPLSSNKNGSRKTAGAALMSKNTVVNRNNEPSKGVKDNNKVYKKNQEALMDQSKEVSISNTIQDLNLKLGEIISNSRSHNFDFNYLENSEAQLSATISNLEDFLMFFDKCPRNVKSNGVDLASLKPIPKSIPSLPLTDRSSRPETPFSGKQPSKRDLLSRPGENQNKAISPRTARAVKTNKNQEKSKEKHEEKARMTPSQQTFQLQQQQHEKTKSQVFVTKIKNFEEALKLNTQNYQQKPTIQTPLPKDNFHEKVTSVNTSKNTIRTSTSKGTRRQITGEKSQESSLLSKQRVQLYSSTTSRPASRTKTKSTENTKNLDLILGSDHVVLANHAKRREIATQSHRSTKNAFNFRVKTPSETTFSQTEKSMGKENMRIDSGTQKASYSKLAFDHIGLQTERGEVKRIGVFGNLELLRKDIMQAPLSERQLSKESLQRSKEFYKKCSKGVRATVLISNETENMKPDLMAYVEQKKISMHKYTKSESRLKKPEITEKVELLGNGRPLLTDGGGPKKTHSPKRQNYVYSNAGNGNIGSTLINTLPTKKLERNTTALKSDRHHYQETMLQNDLEGSTKMFRSRSPKYDVVTKSQNLARKSSGIHHGADYKNQDYSPLRGNKKEGLINNPNRVLSERSPPNFHVGFQH